LPYDSVYLITWIASVRNTRC
jgi:hypothetical protein